MSEYAGTWQVRTERGGEVPRCGLGAADLRRTLRHLRDRGDTRATIDLRDPARRLRVDLTDHHDIIEAGDAA